MSDAIKYYSGNKDMIFVNSFLPRLFEQTKFVITSGVGFSSIAMEALAYECSLLIPNKHFILGVVIYSIGFLR